jgi:hypothetical protein
MHAVLQYAIAYIFDAIAYNVLIWDSAANLKCAPNLCATGATKSGVEIIP